MTNYQKDNHFPRILIVAKTKINEIDSLGASLRNWFMDWPRENLGQIFSANPANSNDFCSHNYCLSAKDRRFGYMFAYLKKSSLGVYATPNRVESATNSSFLHNALYRIKYKTSRFLTNSGVWELLFKPQISTLLAQWITDFNPDVMYVQGHDLTFMRLPLEIKSRFSTPICFQVSDDWVNHLYAKSPVSFILTKIVRTCFLELAKESACNLGVSNLMEEEYFTRYGISFKPLMLCDDITRFDSVHDDRQHSNNIIKIVYSGSLGLNRWKCLKDICLAAEKLNQQGYDIRVIAYATGIPVEAVNEFRELSLLIIHEAVSDEKVPSVLKAADILFLPESFDAEYRSYIKLSISTKCHLYMMSGRPILVYGPGEVGTIDYAKREKWGYVVDKEGYENLAEALKILLTNNGICNDLVKTSRVIAEQKHQAEIVRENLRQTISSAIVNIL